MQRLLTNPKSAWWDNKLTPNVTEGKDEILRQALVEARLELTRELGKDPAKWQWGKLHRLNLEHPVLGGETVPGAGALARQRGPVRHARAARRSSTPTRGTPARATRSTAAPSMRMVVDLPTSTRSTWINQTGVSGHPTDDHYADQVDDWVAGRQRPWPFTEAAVRDDRPRRADPAGRRAPAATG